MTVGQAIIAFAAVALVLTVIPGLDTTLVLRTALVQGRWHAFAAAAGICGGLLTWGVAVAVGAAALLAASALAYRIVTVAGLLSMAYLGVSMIVRSFRGQPGAEAATAAEAPHGRAWRTFLVGAMTNLVNPKVGAFYIATIPQFVPRGVSQLAMGVGLAGVHAFLAFAWLAAIILMASAARRWLTRPGSVRIVDRVAGIAMLGFATRLALQSR